MQSGEGLVVFLNVEDVLGPGRRVTARFEPVARLGHVVISAEQLAVLLAEDFLEYVQRPEICNKVAFAEGTYNPVAQMANPEVIGLYNKDELDAIQWDSLPEEMARSVDYGINPDYDAMLTIYNTAKREA